MRRCPYTGCAILGLVALLTIFSWPVDALSDSSDVQSSTGDDALPGLIRVDTAEPIPPGLLVALSSGYGYTGATLGQDDSHHRGASRAVLSYRLLPSLAAALRFDGRYDKHVDSAGSDDGWVGDPRLLLRYRRSLAPGLGAGIQLGVWAPGSDAPSIKAAALSLESSVALSYSFPDQPLLLAWNLGYRLDRSAASVASAQELSLADRMSLGASDFSAYLIAVGARYQVGTAKLGLEWSLDLLHGAGAPPFGQSPMRVGASCEVPVSAALALVASTEVRVSKVVAQEIREALLPFDPRYQLMLGVQFRIGTEKAATRLAVAPINEDDKATQPAEEQLTGLFTGRVLSGEQGVAEAALRVELASGEIHELKSDENGAFSATLPLGPLTIAVQAEGFESKNETYELEGESSTPLAIYVDPILPPGQLRGVVRSFRGRPLKAELRIEPELTVVQTAADGSFEIDLPPGDYVISITVPRFKSQTRGIHIDEDGVTIMNVDLRR